MSRPSTQIRYGNRLMQLKQQTETLQKHYQSLRKTRPMTGNTVERNGHIINNKKGQMVQQNRFTEIQRENRILFQKISTIMTKGTISQSLAARDKSNTQINKTLNGGYRKKQMLKIEYQNAKMLKRLKQKKSSYGVMGYQREWQKKKKVIQNMSLYPFILNDNMGALVKRQKINDSFLMGQHRTFQAKQDKKARQIRRIRKINGCMFLITIRIEDGKLFIIGDIKEEQNIKIIELQSKEAENFIIDECDENVENIFNLLRFDHESGDLYLVGKDVGQIDRVKELQNERRKSVSQHETRSRKAVRSRVQNNLRPPLPMSKQLARRNNYTLDVSNEKARSIGYINIKNDDVGINYRLNILEQQMNEEISGKLIGKEKQGGLVLQKQQNIEQKRLDIKSGEKSQSKWVRIQKQREQDFVFRANQQRIQNSNNNQTPLQNKNQSDYQDMP